MPLLLPLRPDPDPLLPPSLRMLPFVPELLPDVPLPPEEPLLPLPPDEPEFEPLLPDEPDPLPPFLATAGENAAPASHAIVPTAPRATRNCRLEESALMIPSSRRSTLIAHLSQFVSGLSVATCYMLATEWMLTRQAGVQSDASSGV